VRLLGNVGDIAPMDRGIVDPKVDGQDLGDPVKLEVTLPLNKGFPSAKYHLKPSLNLKGCFI